MKNIKNIKIDLGFLKKFFKQHISILLWLFLAIVVLAEAFVVKGAVGMVQRVRNTPPNVQTSIVRVNLSQYGVVENLLQDYTAFEPSVTTNNNPFGLAPHSDN